jgi:hypothetical protein
VVKVRVLYILTGVFAFLLLNAFFCAFPLDNCQKMHYIRISVYQRYNVNGPSYHQAQLILKKLNFEIKKIKYPVDLANKVDEYILSIKGVIVYDHLPKLKYIESLSMDDLSGEVYLQPEIYVTTALSPPRRTWLLQKGAWIGNDLFRIGVSSVGGLPGIVIFDENGNAKISSDLKDWYS